MKKLCNPIAMLLIICTLLTACGAAGTVSCYPEAEDTAAPQITATPQPTATSQPTATPEPEGTPETPAAQTPTETEAPAEGDAIERYMQTLTLREKVGQLFFIRPDALDSAQTPGQINSSETEGVKTLTDDMRAVLAAYPVGGVAIFGKNISDPETLRAFTEQLRDATTVPLFLGVDEEGGLVARLANNAAFGLPKYESAAAVGASGNPADAENMGRTIGGYLADYGFTVDFAPVADVYTNPANTVIGSRAFSADANTAAAMAGACARGLASQGVLPVYKHFPGHGDTAEDSHNGLAVTYKTHDELAVCEWIPYSANDLTGCAVMVGHIAAPNVTGDLTPASLSGTMITGYLRGELGFTGLVITDSMAMHGVTDAYSSGDAAIAAIEAGVDIILMPEVLSEAFDAVVAAVENGTISEARLNESVYRVLQYKQLYGIFNL